MTTARLETRTDAPSRPTAAPAPGVRQERAAGDGGGAPTMWGLDIVQLHDRYWASRGVQIVRWGEPAPLADEAELYLLLDPRTLTIFSLVRPIDVLTWEQPDVVFVRLHDRGSRPFRERVVTDDADRLVRIERVYAETDWRLRRAALTADRHLAEFWQEATDAPTAWRKLRSRLPRDYRTTCSVSARVFSREDDRELFRLVRTLMKRWKQPDMTIGRARRGGEDVWRDEQAQVDESARVLGPVWVGANRRVAAGETVVGPAVLWDDPGADAEAPDVPWRELEPSHSRPADRATTSGPSRLFRAYKRCFDVVFAAAALLLTLPLYPVLMLFIWLEDGRPFFYVARRETKGGREFGCIKFRSMRRDADRIKADLAAMNQADGPQFFIDDDPRVTRIGKLMRDTNLDEIPQLINVLKGEMSIVGPRPSPRAENQFCPQWREARLSVRPGVTGLWQIKRSRRQGLDFQEWIRYDLEYVERANPFFDIFIIYKTFVLILSKVFR